MPRVPVFALSPLLGLALLALPLAAPAAAQAEAPLAERAPAHHAMLEAIGLYDILAIMSEEGISAARDMEADMFPGRGGAAWEAVVTRIHAADRLIADFDAAFPVDRMSAEDVAAIAAFAAAAPGTEVFAGELAARRAFLDPEVEAAATEAVGAMIAEGAPRIALLTRFIEVNDLVERNVMGALNSNFAFYRGLADGGAFTTEIPEDLMLAEVLGQEAEIRADTIEWLYAYQGLAYSALGDADLEAYVALSETPAGQALNAALFEAFDVLFDAVSYELGRAAGIFIAGEDT